MTATLFELKKQASFFFREKIKTARLVLTDVTPVELLTEEATSENPWASDTRTLGSISKAAFEVDDYWRVVAVLHKRFSKFDKTNWRSSYNSLILLEHLLTHGPESVAGEFQSDKDVIMKIGSFQLIDEKGFNWGLTVRKKCERVLKLLEKGDFYKEERERSRKLTRGIKGFGSVSLKNPSGHDFVDGASYERCNAHFTDSVSEESLENSSWGNGKMEINEKRLNVSKTFSYFKCDDSLFKGTKVSANNGLHKWSSLEEDDRLVNDSMVENNSIEEAHPFHCIDKQAAALLLSEKDETLRDR